MSDGPLGRSWPRRKQQRAIPPRVPDIDALTAKSDFTVFMRREVPEDLRRVALRRLWVLMKLPMSCDELCYEPEPPAPDLARSATEKLPVAAR